MAAATVSVQGARKLPGLGKYKGPDPFSHLDVDRKKGDLLSCSVSLRLRISMVLLLSVVPSGGLLRPFSQRLGNRRSTGGRYFAQKQTSFLTTVPTPGPFASSLRLQQWASENSSERTSG